MSSNISVLVLTYNRPQFLKNTLDRLLKSSYQLNVYVSVDGPKKNETDLNQRVISILKDSKYQSLITTTQISRKNYGVRRGVSRGIDWFFQQVEQGIIVEDDLEFGDGFIMFCNELLDKYRDDKRVMMISGNNIFPEVKTNDSYFFSRHALIWGWATWKERWQEYHSVYDQRTELINNQQIKEKLARVTSKSRVEFAVDALTGKLDSWAYIWGLVVYLNNGLCVVPQRNLVRNVGFGKNATHTKFRSFHADLDIADNFSISSYPNCMLPNQQFDTLFIKYDNLLFLLFKTLLTSITRKITLHE